MEIAPIEYDIVHIFSKTGELIDSWEDDKKHDCFREYCGGCNRCIEMQYEYAGYVVEVLRVSKILDKILEDDL